MVATKTKELDKQRALQLLNTFLEEFRACCRERSTPHISRFSSMIAENFQNSSNGELIGRNLHDFLHRIEDVQRKYSEMEISRIKDCIIAGNKCIIQYDMVLTTPRGEKRMLNIMAIATIEGDLIMGWSQVAHEKHHTKRVRSS